MTLYLKYRPQKISELDLVNVRKAMGDILKAANLPHAFLFTGSRGTGKTSSARILAKAVNCLDKKDYEPCGVCELCISIANGSCSDVIEIDAASNRGIDEIRTLRDQVNLAPMQAKYKVYIIDEVHMLTVEAMNALLKTLEEPPAHALFVLCTTEANKILDTIVSRCIQIQFGHPTITEIVDKLVVVSQTEGLKIDVADLAKVAKAGKGSFRDSIKILEQVIMSGGDISGVLGIIETASPEQFMKLVQGSNTKEALDMIDLLVNRGASPRTFIEQTVNYLREQLLANTKDLSVLPYIAGLEKAYEQSKNTAVAQLPLELFVLTSTKSADIPVVRVTTAEPAAKPVVIKETKAVVIESVVEVRGPNEPKKMEELIAKWPEILKLVKTQNNSIEALLRSTKPRSFNGTNLELEVFYTFHKDKLESEKCRILIEKAVGDAFGMGPAKLKLVLGAKQEPNKTETNIGGKVGEDILAAAEAIFGVQAV